MRNRRHDADSTIEMLDDLGAALSYAKHWYGLVKALQDWRVGDATVLEIIRAIVRNRKDDVSLMVREALRLRRVAEDGGRALKAAFGTAAKRKAWLKAERERREAVK